MWNTQGQRIQLKSLGGGGRTFVRIYSPENNSCVYLNEQKNHKGHQSKIELEEILGMGKLRIAGIYNQVTYTIFNKFEIWER